MLKIMLRHTAISVWYAARILLLFVLVLGISTALMLQYWVMPNIERFHGDIEAAATAALGRPLTIARIEAGWDGLHPSLLLSEVNLRDDHNKVALQLPAMRNTVAWSSLLFGELRFHSLQLDRPQIMIRRDVSGRLYVAGIQSEAQASAAFDPGTADWLLRQRQIVIRNGRAIWQDEMRGAPALAFERVELTITNFLDHHQFIFRAEPSSILAAAVEVQGDLHGDDFTARQSWHGEMRADLTRLHVAAGRAWLDLPPSLQQGNGDLTVSLQLAQGEVAAMDAQMNLQDVQARLGSELPELSVRRMKGRLGWRRLNRGFEISATAFSLRLKDGFSLPPTNFLLMWNDKHGYRSASGEVSANAIDLSHIGLLFDYLPLGESVKKRVAEWAPQGRVRNLHASWQGDIEKLMRYEVQGQFEQVAMRQVGNLPGFSGLSGSVDGNENDGVLVLDSRDFNIQAPGFLAEPLQFDRVSGQLDWQRISGQSWALKLNNMRVANADLAGTLVGGYQLDREGPGVSDLTVNLTRVAVSHAARYIPPHAFGDATYRWLQTGLQGGLADAFQLRVRGDLRDFPFADGKTGLFRITARAKDVAIEFVPGWPRIEQAQADLLIQGKVLEVKSVRAMTAGVALQNVRVAIPDTLAREGLLMEVDGAAAGDTQQAIDYIHHSPVGAYLGEYTDRFQARGKGALSLHLSIPLGQSRPASVRGSYRIDDNELDLGPHLPLLEGVQGEFSFSNETLQAQNITARVLGGPARLSLSKEGGTLLIDADGTLDADSLHARYSYPLLRKLHGKTDWQAKIRVRDKRVDVQVKSDLRGLASGLPVPFNKSAEQKSDLTFELKDINALQDSLRLRYGEIFEAELLRTGTAEGEWEIRRGNIVLGQRIKPDAREGIWISGHLPRLELQGWSGWSDLPQREGVLPNIAGIDVTLDQVTGFDSQFNDLSIRGSGRNGLVSTRLASPEVNGDLIWQPQDQGKLLVRLKQLKLGEGGAVDAAPPQPIGARTVGPVSIPAIDMAVENLHWKGKHLGNLEVTLEGDAGDVVLNSLRLTNPDALVEANGRWRTGKDETQVNIKIEIIDAGKLLGRSGYPDSVTGAKGVFETVLTWQGAPDAFNYPSLFGSIRVNVGKGRFLKLNPGAGKLLGVLSLQSLPKRVSLDFTDVFSPGFQFDKISGLALIESGMLKTEDFTMMGSSARVTLRGEVDITRETQKLRVRVFPAVSDNVSLLSFAAGPVVGVGVLLANKLLRNPLDKLVAFDYNISGSWADPVVERKGSSKPTPDNPDE
ncbi:YhdP family protein [Ferrigenium sp. UT4]